MQIELNWKNILIMFCGVLVGSFIGKFIIKLLLG